MSAFTDAELEYLASQRLGRLATLGPDGAPQNRPVGFRHIPQLDTVDSAGANMGSSRKYRNVAADARVAFVVDDLASTDPCVPAGWRFAVAPRPCQGPRSAVSSSVSIPSGCWFGASTPTPSPRPTPATCRRLPATDRPTVQYRWPRGRRSDKQRRRQHHDALRRHGRESGRVNPRSPN
jgi:PPOX class F420-dependent enzyme/OxyR family protein